MLIEGGSLSDVCYNFDMPSREMVMQMSIEIIASASTGRFLWRCHSWTQSVHVRVGTFSFAATQLLNCNLFRDHTWATKNFVLDIFFKCWSQPFHRISPGGSFPFHCWSPLILSFSCKRIFDVSGIRTQIVTKRGYRVTAVLKWSHFFSLKKQWSNW